VGGLAPRYIGAVEIHLTLMEKNRFKYRILDANFNRAREALRVVEDIVRFTQDNENLYRRLKKIRHDLSKISSDIYPILLRNRNSAGDVSLPQKEKGRKNVKDILIANFLRAEEAIRVLEEFAKLISADAGYRFKKIRFAIYSLEKEIMGKKALRKSYHDTVGTSRKK